MSRSYYTILGIPAQASQADVRAAYRRLAKQFHPDCYGGGGRPFLDVQEAYSVLGDAARRREYDDSLARRRRDGTPLRGEREEPDFGRDRGPRPDPGLRREWHAGQGPEPLVPGDRRRCVGSLLRGGGGWTQVPGPRPPLCDDLFEQMWERLWRLSRF